MQPINQRFQEDDQVLVWYPPQDANGQDPDKWSWLPGTILNQCGPDEWRVIVEAASLSRPDPDFPNGEAPENRLYPTCFRDATELRTVSTHEWDRLYQEWAHA